MAPALPPSGSDADLPPVKRAQLPAFWLAVGGVSLIAPVLFNIAADRLGNAVPGLRTLNDYVTRRNG